MTSSGRPQKLGNVRCPDPKCKGYFELGRIRQKKIRNRPTGRTEERNWFRHNDSSIPEHYVDNFFKRKEAIPLFVTAVDKDVHSLIWFAKQLDECQIEEGEKQRMISAFKHHIAQIIAQYEIVLIHGLKAHYDRQNQPMPKELEYLWNDVVEIENHVKIEQEKIKKMMEEDPSQAINYNINLIAHDPYFRESWQLTEKYLIPKRKEKNRLRNKKLSDWPLRSTAYSELHLERIMQRSGS